MTPDSTFYVKKIRRLSQALFISGALNIGVLALFSYWVVRERPPTPYCELKPATSAQQQKPLADNRGASEVIRHLRQLPFSQLIGKLSSTLLIEDGYTERDLALAYLVGFQHFDLDRALPGDAQPKQKRQLAFKGRNGEEKVVTVYPGLTDQQFDSIIHFARTEQWPMTPEGLFLLMQKQKKDQNIDSTLAEAFILTPEFLTIELLFSRSEADVRKQRLLEVILDGDWTSLKQFAEQQRQLNDLSDARRQKFLLDYVKLGSETAAYLLLETEGDFVAKKLDDAQVIAILQLLSAKTVESEQFALNMLTSPRSTSVWQQASLRLYEYAGEPIPKDWNYQTSLARFAPDKVKPEVVIPPPVPPVVVAKKNVEKVKPAVVKTTTTPSRPIAQAIPQKTSTSNKVAAAKPKTSDKKSSKAPACRLYIVQEGDSLWKISRRFGVDMEVLKKKNQLKSDSIKPGTVLKIP